MKLTRLLLVALALECAFGADGVTVTGSSSGKPDSARDTGIVTLPGTVARKPVSPKPAPEPPKPALPDAFKEDSSLYLQKVIGTWKKTDAHAILGEPVRQRVAYDENKVPSGQVLAYKDPSGRFSALELEFDNDGGALRSVFAYPKQMTWEDCRKAWGADVNTTHGEKGRKFYSYLNRKLDVLVDGGGKVISLGWY